MLDLQALVDGMSAQWQKERADKQMTLGQLIEALEAMDAATPVNVSAELNSYRGYYCDLSIEPGASTAGELLAECKDAMGEVFEGYKGGDFLMGRTTPMWVADYGRCGDRLMGIGADGQIVTAPDEA